jgi:hypothetical protein
MFISVIYLLVKEHINNQNSNCVLVDLYTYAKLKD